LRSSDRFQSNRRGKYLIRRLSYARCGLDSIKRVFAQAMTKRHHCNAARVFNGGLRSRFERGKSAGRASYGQLASMPVRRETDAERGYTTQKLAFGRDAREHFFRAHYLLTKARLLRVKLLAKSRRVALESLSTHHYFDSLIEVGNGCDLGEESESVEELRAQFPLFGIA
jgi:hypothetical protein